MAPALASQRAAPARAGRRSAMPVLAFLSFGSSNKAAAREAKKQELLDAIKPLQRGLSATPEEKRTVERLASQLEKLNPTKSPLASPLLNGKWELLYTTSESILGSKRPALLRPWGPIFQLLDGASLTARNQETTPLFNSVSAELSPLSASKVAVQFKTFKLLGLLPVSAPPSARGELAVTYLDEALRVSRGDKGNLFVLAMRDAAARP